MPRHDGSVGGRGRDDDDPGNVLGDPTKLLAHDPRHDAELSRQRGEEVLQIGHRCLHLDDQQDPRARVPGENVDGTSIAEVVEGELGQNFPFGGLQDLDRRVHDRSMGAVKKPISTASTPPGVDRDDHLEGGRNPPELRKPDRLEPPEFEIRDGLLTDGRPGSHVGLS